MNRTAPLRRSRVKAKPTKRSTFKNLADRLWSLKVRERDECELAEYHAAKFPCSGNFQAQHGFSRRYLGTRWVLLNGFCGCSASHRWFTTHPLEWDQVLRAEWGETVYEELRQRALTFKGPLDYRLIADALR